VKEYAVLRRECGVGGRWNYMTEVTFPPKVFCICEYSLSEQFSTLVGTGA
jgi:hypothetical protein